jgi:uncharacterized membrane protein
MNNELYFVLAIMSLTWLMLLAAIAFLPYYTRKSIAFGIAVPKEQYHSDFFVTLRQHYLWACLGLGGVLMPASTLSILYLPETTAAMISITAMLLFVALAFVFCARSYNRVRDFKRNSDWTISSVSTAQIVERKDARKLFNPAWYLTHFILIAALVAVSLALYPSLPERIPQNYDLSGKVNTYAAKSVGTVLAMPALQLGMTLLFAGIGWGINRAKRQTDDTNIEQGLRHNRTFQIVMGRSMFWLGFAVQLILAGVQLSILGLLHPQVTLWASLALLAGIIMMTVYITLAVGQGGHQLSETDAAARAQAPADVAGDDSTWTFFGSLYNNPNDPSIFVEKRVGVGWTLNLGTPLGKTLLIATGALVAALLIALPFLAAMK